MLVPEKRSAPQYVVVKCVYFKRSGKFYCAGAERFELELFRGCIYPRDYAERLRDLKILPGLQSGTWKGPIMVETDYPELLLPTDAAE